MNAGNGNSPTSRPTPRNKRQAQAQSGVLMTLSGRGIVNAPMVLAGIDGVTGIHQLDDDPD